MPTKLEPEDSDAEDYELLASDSQNVDETLQKDTMGLEEESEKKEGRKGDSLASYAALSASAVTLVVTWLVMLFNQPTSVGWFLLHPTLETLAMLLITYGIMTLQPTSQPRSKVAGLSRHQAAILFIGLPALLVGTFAIVMNKFAGGKPHFKSWHSIFGITAAGWIVIQVLVGGSSVWFGGRVLGGGAKAKAIWKYHRLSGYFLFPSLLATIVLGGGFSHWGERNVWFPLRLVAYVVAPLVCFVAVLSRIRTSKMKFL